MKLRELLWLLPALALYVLLIVVFAMDVTTGDEPRYLGFAENLTHGFYTTREEPELWNGPGYPLLLVPFVATGAPLLAMKLLNAVFLFIAICLMYATARQYAGRTASLVLAWLSAVYLPYLRWLPFVLTEAITIMLVACSTYLLVRWYRTRTIGWFFGSAVALAYLALTKVFFGWVLMSGSVIFLVLSLAKPFRPLWRAGVALGLALLLCLPYLVYTHTMTGRVLYWSNAGGANLYCLTTPYEGEYGNWRTPEDVLSEPELARHKPLYEELEKLGPIERDERLMQEAVSNIRRFPKKCLKNWGLNVTRMLFSFPYSYTLQKPSTLFYLVPNMFLVSLMLSLVYPTIVGRRRIPPEVFALLLLTFIVLGGTSLLNADGRHFAVAVPLLTVWILVVLERVVRIRLLRQTPAGPAQPETSGKEPPEGHHRVHSVE